MAKKAKRCPKKCLNHSFLLKPVHYSANFSRELSASFCPSALANPSITPKFNRDKRCYTSSFMLPIDDVTLDQGQIKLKTNQDYYRTEHERYKMQNCHPKSNIVKVDQIKMIAKPKSKSSYCNVCKIQYEDYLDHITSEKHKIKINENKFNTFIDEMCVQIQNKTKDEEFILKQSQFIQNSQTSLFCVSQETNQSDDKNLQRSCSSFLEYKGINNLIHTSKNFHPLTECVEYVNNYQMNNQNNDIGLDNPLLSPIKKYSEATDYVRLMTNIKIQRPIIISRANCVKLNQ